MNSGSSSRSFRRRSRARLNAVLISISDRPYIPLLYNVRGACPEPRAGDDPYGLSSALRSGDVIHPLTKGQDRSSGLAGLWPDNFTQARRGGDPA